MARAMILAAMLLVQPAMAADSLPPTQAAPQADWSGVYVGAFGGAAISSGRAELGAAEGFLLPLDISNGLFPDSISRTRANAAVGVAAGMNFQSGAFVGGFEADVGYAWTRIESAFSRIDPGPIFPGVETNTRYGTDFGAMGTARLRGGYALGDTLLFASGGLAVGEVRNRFALSLPNIVVPGVMNGYASEWSSSDVEFGYAVSVGVEHRLTDNISLKFETMYVNLADRDIKASDPTAFPGESISYSFSNDVVIPRLGLSVKF